MGKSARVILGRPPEGPWLGPPCPRASRGSSPGTSECVPTKCVSSNPCPQGDGFELHTHTPPPRSPRHPSLHPSLTCPVPQTWAQEVCGVESPKGLRPGPAPSVPATHSGVPAPRGLTPCPPLPRGVSAHARARPGCGVLGGTCGVCAASASVLHAHLLGLLS